MTIQKLLILFSTISIIYGRPQNNEDRNKYFEDLMKEIFYSNETTPKNTQYKSCGFQKECVPRYLCNDGHVNEYGVGIVDIRSDAYEECVFLEICCNVSDEVQEPVTFKPQPVESNSNNLNDSAPANNSNPIKTHEQLNMRNGCGYRNINGYGFKISGASDGEAEFAEFPWMAALLSEEQTAGSNITYYECGAAIIAPNAVITAAHCVNKLLAKDLLVRAGEWDTQTELEILPHQHSKVKEIIMHENYNKGTLFNDIAVLILNEPLEWKENVQPICLPPVNTEFDYSRCFATGWGKNKFGKDGTYQVILKKIDLPIVPREACQQNLRTTRLGKYFKLHETFICAGGEKFKDTCKGDGGSPLVCPISGSDNRYYQAGIVSWGIGCGDESIPGVYANVANLRNWLNNVLKNRNIDFKHFTA